MRLPKELTTVTPLSKGLAMLLFILFPFFGFYLGICYQQLNQDAFQPPIAQTTLPTSSPIWINDPTTAAYFVQAYYTMYVDCLNLNSDGCSTIAYNSAYIDPTFAKQLQQESGGDAILCAANIPASITVVSEKAIRNIMHIGVKENFQNPAIIYADVQRINNRYEIVGITCSEK